MLAFYLANRLVLQPSKNRLPYESLTRVTYQCSLGEIEAFVAHRHWDGEQLRDGPWDPAKTAKPQLLVLKLGGTAGRGERSTLFPANMLDHVSSEVWTWNPPGYGLSSGRATLAGIAKAAVEFFSQVLADRRSEDTCVWIVGNSLGCATGLYLANHIDAHGLILRNPPPLIDLIWRRNAWWNLGFGGSIVASGIPPEMDAVLSASQVTAPILFIESERDSLVLPVLQAIVRDAHPGPQKRLVLEGAEHATPIDESYRDELQDLLNWLWESSRDKNPVNDRP